MRQTVAQAVAGRSRSPNSPRHGSRPSIATGTRSRRQVSGVTRTSCSVTAVPVGAMSRSPLGRSRAWRTPAQTPRCRPRSRTRRPARQAPRRPATGPRRASPCHSPCAGARGPASSPCSTVRRCAKSLAIRSWMPMGRPSARTASPSVQSPGRPAPAHAPPVEQELALEGGGGELVPRDEEGASGQVVDARSGDGRQREQVVVGRQAQLQARRAEAQVEQRPRVSHRRMVRPRGPPAQAGGVRPSPGPASRCVPVPRPPSAVAPAVPAYGTLTRSGRRQPAGARTRADEGTWWTSSARSPSASGPMPPLPISPTPSTCPTTCLPSPTWSRSPIDGADDPDAEATGEPTRFLPDAGARRIEWGRPGSGYEGSFTVEPGTTSTSQVTIRLRLRDDAPAEEIERMLAQAARSIGSKVRGY